MSQSNKSCSGVNSKHFAYIDFIHIHKLHPTKWFESSHYKTHANKQSIRGKIALEKVIKLSLFTMNILSDGKVLINILEFSD